MATAPVKNPGFPGPPKFASVEDERRHRKERLAASFRLFSKFGFDEGVTWHITARDPERPASGRRARLRGLSEPPRRLLRRLQRRLRLPGGGPSRPHAGTGGRFLGRVSEADLTLGATFRIQERQHL